MLTLYSLLQSAQTAQIQPDVECGGRGGEVRTEVGVGGGGALGLWEFWGNSENVAF